MVVAIDGPAGVGKSTIARKIAGASGFLYLNSGSLYRAVTLAVLRAGIDPGDERSVVDTAQSSDCRFEHGRLFLNGEEVEEQLRTDDVDRLVARISSVPGVRRVVNRILKEIAAGTDAVTEGRDMATVVFPDAEVKVFLDASVEVRAARRHGQGTSALTLGEIETAIRERDEIDRKKPEGRLKIAEDAIYIDTSDLTINQVCDKVVTIIRDKQTRTGSIGK